MKRFIRCTSLVLALVMMLTIPAFAAEPVQPRASSFFIKSSVYLCNVSGTYFEAWFDVTGMGTMDVVGAKYIKIQRSSDNTNWTTVKTFTKESYPSLVDTNTTVHAAGVSYVGTGGYYYRAHIQLYAENSTGYGTWDRYTSSIYIPAN